MKPRFFSDFKLAQQQLRTLAIEAKQPRYLYVTHYGQWNTPEYSIRTAEEILDPGCVNVLQCYTPGYGRTKRVETPSYMDKYMTDSPDDVSIFSTEDNTIVLEHIDAI